MLHHWKCCALLVSLFILISCSGGSDPVSPVSPSTPLPDNTAQVSERILFGMGAVRIDPTTCAFEVINLRNAASHLNVINFLELNPCTNCLTITAVQPGTFDTLLVDIDFTHPYLDQFLTAFDTRLILMFNGSNVFPESGFTFADRFSGDAGLANAHGYTTLNNPETAGNGLEGWIKGKHASDDLPNCRLNPYLRITSDDPSNTRNAFFAGDIENVTAVIDKPDGPFILGYAVDANWAKPINKPVDDPIEDFGPDANCPEAWNIEVTEAPVGGGMNDFGGETVLTIDVYDWQGPDTKHPPVIECPDLFSGTVEAEWVADFDGFSRYEATIQNLMPAQSGTYQCLISKEAQENNPSKWWLDLTSYQVNQIVVNHPFNPVDITPGILNIDALDVEVDGNYAYVSISDHRLRIYDISDPQNPSPVNTLELSSEVNNIAYGGGYVYACQGFETIAVIDVDPPEFAEVVRTVDVGYDPTDVSFGDGYVFAVTVSYYVDSYLEIIDISVPEEAQIVSATKVEDNAWLVTSVGNTVYTVSNSNFEIWDISNPIAPIRLKKLSVPDNFVADKSYGIIVSDGYAYVTTRQHGVYVVDVLPPDQAEVVANLEPDAWGLGLSGSNIFFTDLDRMSGNLYVADISNPSAPVITNTFAGYGGLIDIDGDHAYFAGHDLKIADISQPDNVTGEAFIGTTYGLKQMAIKDGYCYATDYADNLRIFDIDPVESTHFVSSTYITQWLESIDIENGYAYMGEGDHGFAVVDIDPVENPVITTIVDIQGSVFDVEVEGNYAYVGSNFTLFILDISDLDNPQVISEVDTVSWAYDVEYRDGYVFAATSNSTFIIIDVSDPASPSVVATVEIPGEGNYMALDDEYAVVTFSDGIAFIDINPLEDAYLVTFNWLENSGYVQPAIIDGYALVDENTTKIFDIRPPWLGEKVFEFDQPDYRGNLAIVGNILFTASSDGLFITQLY